MQQKSLVARLVPAVVIGLITASLSVFYFSKGMQSSRESSAGVIEVSDLDGLSDATAIPDGSYVSFQGELDPDRVIRVEEQVGFELTGHFIGLRGIDDTLVHCGSSSATSENVVKPCFPNRRAIPKPDELAEFARSRSFQGQIFGKDEFWRAGPSYLMSDAAEEFRLQDGFRVIALDATPADATTSIFFGNLMGYVFGFGAVVCFGTVLAGLIHALIVRNRAVQHVGAQEEHEVDR